MKKPRKTSSRALKEKAAAKESVIRDALFKDAGQLPSANEVAEYVTLATAADLGEEGAEALARFEVDVVTRFVEPAVRDFEALHPPLDAGAREMLGSMFRFFAVLGYHAAAKEAYDKQLAATVTAVTKSKRKAAERHSQIMDTFNSMSDGTKTDRVRRTADALELSPNTVWNVLRDID
jgi:hypothetical protein